MTDEAVPGNEAVGTRVVLPCGHRVVLPWAVPPEAVLADLLRHQSECEVDAGGPFFPPVRSLALAPPNAAEALQ